MGLGLVLGLEETWAGRVWFFIVQQLGWARPNRTRFWIGFNLQFEFIVRFTVFLLQMF